MGTLSRVCLMPFALILPFILAKNIRTVSTALFLAVNVDKLQVLLKSREECGFLIAFQRSKPARDHILSPVQSLARPRHSPRSPRTW